MNTSDQALRELRSMCDLPATTCKAAIKKHGPNAEAALRGLIEEGKVAVDQLNPDTVSDELWWQARKQNLPATGLLAAMKNGSILGRKLSKDVAAMLAGVKQRMQATAPNDMELAVIAGEKQRARLKRNPQSLKLPPLPELQLTTDAWVGKDCLKAWAKFESPTLTIDSRKHLKGEVDISIPLLGDRNKPAAPPRKEQVAAYAHLLAHGEKIRNAILEAVQDEFMEDFDSVDELKGKMGPRSLLILPVAKAGHAYIGIYFACAWDDEHGLGVLIHKSRAVAVGQHEVSVDNSAAEDDGGKRLKP